MRCCNCYCRPRCCCCNNSNQTGITNLFNGTQMQLVNSGNTLIPDNGVIVFDTSIINQNPNVSYNLVNGDFVISKSGSYLIHYQVNIDGTEELTNSNLSIFVNNSLYSTSSTPIVTGHMTGSTFINVTSVPTTISLRNTSTDGIVLSNNDVQANITIVG